MKAETEERRMDIWDWEGEKKLSEIGKIIDIEMQKGKELRRKGERKEKREREEQMLD